jgi:hypothetical protein
MCTTWMLPTEFCLCEICAFLRYYAAYVVNSLPTFRDNLSITYSRVKISCPINMGRRGYPETSVRNWHRTLRNITEEASSHLFCGGSLKSCIIICALYNSDNKQTVLPLSPIIHHSSSVRLVVAFLSTSRVTPGQYLILHHYSFFSHPF